MDTRLTIAISAARRENLSSAQQQFLTTLTELVERRGMAVLPGSPTSDNLETRIEKVRQCQGVIVYACSQWQAERVHRRQERKVILPSEFAHMEAVMSVATKRPVLLLHEKGVAERGAIRGGYLPHVVKVPASANHDWLGEADFESEFNKWVAEVECFRHVFLGYSSKATPVADALRKFMSDQLKLRVFDWQDFSAGDTIWESIERAERLTSCGLFLFMADDTLGAGRKKEFAPRDNVVYEAGYFAGAKGRARSLVIREDGAKVPSDLGGILYLRLANRADTSTIERPLREHLEQILSRDYEGS